MDSAIASLKGMKGVVDLESLQDMHRWEIERIEQSHNLGMHTVLEKDNILILVHDSQFRDPYGKLVVKKRGKAVLPALPFPELERENVVSASPSKKVHDFILKHYGFSAHPEFATILIGFDA